ncbi:kinase-like protein [Macrolepiota fuliginosa MF-IS2]|uniref:mitogen-activated protein kinase kinase n=1 Tax=Macrolepiota fuliginosa MF-IS2 TaxID=1400762 RepID=A0A9P6CAD8_9AGAR|nr:kinase-like protein [Macrolepiota fuliginosa MF-IS2]
MERPVISRPIGPRGPHKPTPPSKAEPIRKPSPPVLLIPGGNPTAKPLGKPLKGLKLDVSAIQSMQYYSGPSDPQVDYMSPEEAPTLRPNQETEVPTQSNEPFNLISMLKELGNITQNPPPAEDNSDPDLEVSSSLGNWSDEVIEELHRLGEGAGGAVHKVKDKRSGRIMARKTITTRQAPRQLLREVSIMTSTRHINIIRFYGAYISPSTSEVKILMEYSEGGSLETVGKRLREYGAVVGEKIAGRLAEGILQGLAYLHSKRTIHRDIKPSNILLTSEGIVRLCDFGVSGELIGSIANTFTGTSFYMAPERISGDKYTIRSDVWSTGITLLELVQNRFPFPNDLPPIELMVYITQNEPPSLEDEPGVQWTDEMKDFIKQTLIVNQQMRPIPKDMLAHPWITNTMKQDVHMARWIGEVYGWPKRKSGDQ